jgi:hypothetical protein
MVRVKIGELLQRLSETTKYQTELPGWCFTGSKKAFRL